MNGNVARRPRLVARALLACIRAYQVLARGLPSRCRYLPTCSEYAAEAIEAHGAARGVSLALRRVGRCHPWGGHGYDPVPTPASESSQISSQASPVPIRANPRPAVETVSGR